MFCKVLECVQAWMSDPGCRQIALRVAYLYQYSCKSRMCATCVQLQPVMGIDLLELEGARSGAAVHVGQSDSNFSLFN